MLPGLLFLLAFATVGYADHWYTIQPPGNLDSNGLKLLTSFWVGFGLLVLVLAVSYAVGTLIHAVDSWIGRALGQNWQATVRVAAEGSSQTFESLKKWGEQRFGWKAVPPADHQTTQCCWQRLVSWVRRRCGCEAEDGSDQSELSLLEELHNAAQSLVVLRSPSFHALEQRYDALADFCGHSVWAVVANAFALMYAFWPSGPWTWVSVSATVVLVGLIFCSCCALKGRQFNIRVTRVKWVWEAVLLLSSPAPGEGAQQPHPGV